MGCRTPEEHAAGAAPGSINVPLLFLGPDGTPSEPNPAFVEQVQAALPDKAAGGVGSSSSIDNCAAAPLTGLWHLV